MTGTIVIICLILTFETVCHWRITGALVYSDRFRVVCVGMMDALLFNWYACELWKLINDTCACMFYVLCSQYIQLQYLYSCCAPWTQLPSHLWCMTQNDLWRSMGRRKLSSCYIHWVCVSLIVFHLFLIVSSCKCDVVIDETTGASKIFSSLFI